MAYTHVMAGPCPINPEGPQPPAKTLPTLNYCPTGRIPAAYQNFTNIIMENLDLLDRIRDEVCLKKNLVCRIRPHGQPFNSAECHACVGFDVNAWYDRHCDSLFKNCF